MKNVLPKFSAYALRLAAAWLCFSFSGVAAPFSSFTAQEDFLLLGVVRNADDESGVQGVTVRIVGLDKSFVTTSGGEYRIPISRNFIGRPITLQVGKPGWMLVDRSALRLVVLADQLGDPHRIVLRRVITRAPRKPIGVTAKPNPEIVEIRQLMDTAALLEGRGLNEASLQKYDEALAAIRKARVRPQKEELECLTRLSWLQMLLGDYEPARKSLKAAQTLAVMLRSDSQFARSLNLVADLERIQGNNDLARQRYGEARGLFQKVGDRLGEANVLMGLGNLETSLKNYETARQHYHHANGLYLKEDNRLGVANICWSFGDLERALGNKPAARAQ